jgi:hypothetical protein
MAKLSDFRGGSYLKTADLGNKQVKVTIESLVVEEVGEEGKKKQKLVAYFDGMKRGLVMNDTNLETLEMAFGSESDAVEGAEIVLYVDPNVSFAGKRVGGIRIKLPQKKTTAADTAAAIDDEVRF